MSKNKFNSFSALVYSTHPDTLPPDREEAISTPAPSEQKLKVIIDKKHRGGKIATLVEGFTGADDGLQALGKQLKTLCGSGGSAKDGMILVQGDFKEKITQWLRSKGYQVK